MHQHHRSRQVTQEAITKDNVTVKVNAVVYFRVVDPSAAIVKVEDFRRATWLISQTTLRSVLGQASLDDVLANREAINQNLQRIIDEQTEPWGIKVSIVEVKDVELPDTMKRAMAKQAEAEREKRAKIIHAEGEFSAAQRLVDRVSAWLAARRVTCSTRRLIFAPSWLPKSDQSNIMPAKLPKSSGDCWALSWLLTRSSPPALMAILAAPDPRVTVRDTASSS